MNVPVDLIFELTQTAIALAFVVGLGYAILTGNPHAAEIIPFGTLIIGWYFGKKTTEIRALNGNGNGNGKESK